MVKAAVDMKESFARYGEYVIVYDKDEVTLPPGAYEVERTYYIKFGTRDDHDYNVGNDYFKFVSEEARQAKKNGEYMPTTFSIRNITNPACLEALGLEEKLIYLEPE